ncbi:NADPH-dependent FMN reductase [Streptomyces boninensis]|uniref:NADPH-dependent FMN reductase n=1 Tax=Streptomyces boninensis TaxID=2039455 RepID=UPI003B211637
MTTKVGIIIGSTRPGRNGEQVATWVRDLAAAHAGPDAEFEILDLLDFELPILDEPVPAAAVPGSNPHTVRWAERVGACDAFVFVTPEYNFSPPASLTNAIDYLHGEWSGKAVGYVGYGVHGAVMAVKDLRAQAGFLRMADIGSQVALTLREDFVDMSEFKPQELHVAEVHGLVDELLAWSRALTPLRTAAAAA